MIIKFNINRWNNFFDAYVYIGGSIFMERKGTSKNTYQLDKLLADYFLKKKLIIGANFGPYHSEGFYKDHNNQFKKYYDICFRDKYSKSLFEKLDNVRFAPDVAFQLKLPEVGTISKTVGFSLIDLDKRVDLAQYSKTYYKFIINLIKYYHADGYKIYLFSFCKNEGDEEAISSLLMSIPDNLKEQIKVIRYEGEIDSFLKIYGSVQYMYPTRFHAMILSLKYHQNICPLIYSEKMINVLSDIDYNGKYIRIVDMDKSSEIEIAKNVKRSECDIEGLNIEATKQFLKLDKILKE